jgi:hypothetical protein
MDHSIRQLEDLVVRMEPAGPSPDLNDLPPEAMPDLNDLPPEGMPDLNNFPPGSFPTQDDLPPGVFPDLNLPYPPQRQRLLMAKHPRGGWVRTPEGVFLIGPEERGRSREKKEKK